MLRDFSKSTALKAVLFFFTSTFSFATAATSDKIIGGLTQTEVELSAVVEAFSKQTGKVILPNDGILAALKPRKATIILPTDLRNMEQNAELWDQIYESILSIYGYTMIKKGDIYRLVSSKDTAKMPTPIIDDEGYPLSAKSERIVTQVIQLKHVVSDVVRPLFRYVSEVSPPLALPDKYTMIITAAESDLKYFQSLLKIFDVPSDVPFIKTYTLKKAIASQVKNHIQNYFNVERARAKGAVNPAEQAFLLPDDATNRLLVSAVAEDQQVVEDFIKFFDADIISSHTFRPIEIYKLKNSNAESVAKKLDQVLKSRSSSAPKDATKKEDIPTIVPFEELNALIISVEEAETFRYIKEVIDLLDVKRNQVYIASTIVEVKNTSGFDFGSTFGIGQAPQSNGSLGIIAGGTVSSSTSTQAGTPTFTTTGKGATITPNFQSGLNLAFPYGGFDFIPLVLHAAETDSNLNVLANPSIICDDNEHAVIEITEERSFNTTTNNSGGVATTSFGGFNNAGIILDIKPTISSESFLKLELTQNVDRFLPDTGTGTSRDKRKATTVVTIPNKTSVVIGGMTKSQNSNGRTAVPLLHKIPVLGNLFKSKSESSENSTLYFFITPEIISNFDELSKVSDRLHRKMGAESSKEIQESEAFKDVLNNKESADEVTSTNNAEENNPIDLLKAVFTRRSLSKWLKPEQAKPLAYAIIEHRITDPGLLPDYTRSYFDESKLDQVFQDTLLNANAQLDKLKPERRSEVLATFNLYLVNELEKTDDSIPRRDQQESEHPINEVLLKSEQ